MIAEDIYKNALSLIGETVDTAQNQDYLERAPYILADFCSQMRGIDKAARDMKAVSGGNTDVGVYLNLEDKFPLLDDFAPSAATYLGAMLVIDYDAELYERLFERYCDSISTVCSSIPSVSGSTINKYFCD